MFKKVVKKDMRVFHLETILFEPLLVVIREQGECTFRHKGEGQVKQNPIPR